MSTPNPTTFRVWISKYALTKGVFAIDATSQPDIGNGRMVSDENSRYQTCYHGGDWHRTQEAALEQAEKMRKAKITSLKKQIVKLEALTFSKGK